MQQKLIEKKIVFEFKCPKCGEELCKHIVKEGARYHVHSWTGGNGNAEIHCSESKCEDNHRCRGD